MTDPKLKIKIEVDNKEAVSGVKKTRTSFSKLKDVVRQSQMAMLAFFGAMTAGTLKAISNFTKMEGKIVDTLNLFQGGKKDFDTAF